VPAADRKAFSIAVPAVPLDEGVTLAGYRIEWVLGTGRAGTVYRATELARERTVALRVLAPDLTAHEAFRGRFRHEAALQARLDHPNVLPLYDVVEAEGEMLVAMRLVEGTTLKQLIEAGKLRPPRALEIFDQVAGALDAAHAVGLLHRGLKPQDVLVDKTGRAYLGDFGLTKAPGEYGLTQRERHAASPDYLSPEQIRLKDATGSSDRYAFAAMLYEALRGEVPFARESEAAIFYAHLSEPPPRVSERRAALPSSLDSVLARGLAKDPEDRYASASDLVAAARGAVESGRHGRIRAAGGRHAVVPALIALALLVPLLGLVGFTLGHTGRSADDPVTAAVAGGPLTLAFPPNWRPLAGASGVEGLALRQPIVVTWGAAGSRGELWAGMAPRAEGPLLLPSEFVRRLARPPRPETVRLGRFAAFRYRGLEHRDVRAALTVYVVPTDRGAATVACLQARGAERDAQGRSALERCEDMAATLSLRGAHASGLGPSRRYGVSLDRLLDRLDRVRSARRGALAAAKSSRTQAEAAASLAREFRRTHDALVRIRPGLVERPAHRRLVRHLESAAGAYRALSAAARAGDRAAYRRAARRVGASERKLERGLRSLARRTLS
jgi:hypothetical protein